MATSVIFLSIITALNLVCIAIAFDPRPLQDFCVADPTSPVRINGLACKDPATATADDFFFRGLHLPGNTSNPLGAALTPVSVATVPGLNTLGLTATELLTVLEGSLEVGFITSSPDNKHYSKVLQKGDVFVIPVGLLHYQRNVASANTVALAVVNSQNAGIVAITNGIFGAKPPVNSHYLAKAYLLDQKTIERLQATF
ncbi:putative germin-like protein 2-1 [Phtheirospermum japonicum]|uniref:Germin-like protein n=1 Tax=Phtheirospermum japonicum TaxID=374723 RepID=A0A830BUJ0_9LAMI|nr:putative germin-like protein 2-1 [Phtheirospermum japonicum]GFP91642.1 putative germin-like protein 2-1 [Phtheirospermum japonicum]GFP91643.1 putative germin-like protein 2-1 [Phtheirospermum japonicum]